jgi:hypothetical protein
MSVAQILSDDGEHVAKVDASGALLTSINSVLTPAEFDTIDLVYTAGNVTTVTYKLATVTVATLTLSYTDGLLTQVVRS